MIRRGIICNLWEYIYTEELSSLLDLLGQHASSDYEHFSAFCSLQEKCLGNACYGDAVGKLKVLFPNMHIEGSLDANEMWMKSLSFDNFPSHCEYTPIISKLDIGNLTWTPLSEEMKVFEWNDKNKFVRPNPYNVQMQDNAVLEMQEIRIRMLENKDVYIFCKDNVNMLSNFLNWKKNVFPNAMVYICGTPYKEVASLALESKVPLWCRRDAIEDVEIREIAKVYPIGKLLCYT